MSYSIEYNKAVYFAEKDGERKYFLFVRQGDNNVWDCDNKQRARSWYLETAGTLGDLWKRIGERAGSINGGGLQKSVGWSETERFKIEDYIKQYRSKIKNAKPILNIFDDFSIEAYIHIRDEFETEYDKEYEVILRTLIKKYSMQQSGSYYYDKTKLSYTINLSTIELLEDFFVNMPMRYSKDFIASFRVEKRKKWRGNRYC